jgi:hypothetical protein
LVVVYGLYFAVVYKANRWLFLHGMIKRYEPPGLNWRDVHEYHRIYGSRPADELSVFCFVSFGSAIGWLIAWAFFGLSVDGLIQIFNQSNPHLTDNAVIVNIFIPLFALFLIIVLVSGICVVAKDSASID